MRIAIHAGHNPSGMVACGAKGYLDESDEARKVVAEVLKQAIGLETTVVRTKGSNVLVGFSDDTAVPSGYYRQKEYLIFEDCTINDGKNQQDILNRIVRETENALCDAAISIHLNAFNGAAEGTEAYTCQKCNPIANTIATKIINNISHSTMLKNRGLKKANFFVLTHTSMPAVLVECAFVDNKNDAAKWNPKEIANAIIRAFVSEEDKATSDLPGDVQDGSQLYRVQLGAFKNRENAEKLEKELEDKGYDAFIRKGEP